MTQIENFERLDSITTRWLTTFSLHPGYLRSYNGTKK
jgi:hypothetical protein